MFRFPRVVIAGLSPDRAAPDGGPGAFPGRVAEVPRAVIRRDNRGGRVDVEKIKRRRYFRTLVWWPFLLLLPVAFGVDLLVRAGLHDWNFDTENVLVAAVNAILAWLVFAGVWRWMIRRDQPPERR
jgi:hypothetical protein